MSWMEKGWPAGENHKRVEQIIVASAVGAAVVGSAAATGYLHWRKQRREAAGTDGDPDYGQYAQCCNIFVNEQFDPEFRALMADVAVRAHYATTEGSNNAVPFSALVDKLQVSRGDVYHAINRLSNSGLIEKKHKFLSLKRNSFRVSSGIIQWALDEGAYPVLSQADYDLSQKLTGNL